MEITVLEIPKSNVIPNFVVREYMGVTVMDEAMQPIPSTKQLKEGDIVIVPGLFGEFYRMAMGSDNIARTEGGLGAIIERASDDRNVWTCQGLMNLAALARVDFTA